MPLTRFTLRQIETFVLVSEVRSFSIAGQRLGLTVQAISQLVAELESTVGFRLLERTTRRVDLSSAGRDFLPAAQTVLRHVQAAEMAADDVRNRASGLVRVGAPLVLAATALPQVIHRYANLRPKVVVRVCDVAVDRLVDTVSSGDIDIAVGPDRVTAGGIDDEGAIDPGHLLEARMRVVPVAAALSHLEAVGTGLAGRNAVEADARYAIHLERQDNAVPVD